MSRRLVLSAATLLFLLGCSGGDGGDGGPSGPEGKGRIEGEVVGPGGGVPGARVAVSGGGSVETGSDGSYLLTDLDPGAKTLTITPPSGFTLATGETASKSATVAANSTVSVDWNVRLADATPRTVEVGLAATSFNSDDVTVPVGSTVTWINQTAITHTITPEDANQAGAWTDHTISGQGTEFDHTFANAGTFDYVCKLHAGMTGVIRVH